MILSELATLVSGRIEGRPDIEITGVSTISEARAGDLVFVLEEKFLEAAKKSKAAALVIKEGKKIDQAAIRVDNPRLAMAHLLPLFSKRIVPKPEIHPSAVIAPGAKIGGKVYIGPFVYIGENSSVGDNSIIHPNVTIYDNVIIGKNVILHSGVVLGVDGYGFIPTEDLPIKIPQIGRVVIEDEVEIYSNVCIARGALGETKIGRGTKIDNLTHIAHNCIIGESCLITGQVGFAGSVTLGKRVMVAGQVGFNGHITVGDNCVVLGKAGATKDIPQNSTVSGFPAQDHKKEMREQARLRKLLEKE